jgi:DNA-binding response OmpR family regulator
MKLLIIEGNVSQTLTTTRYLRNEGFFCDTARTYKDALHKIEAFQYDCIVLDPCLPDGQGFNLIKYLRQDEKRAGVIIVSEQASLQDKITGFDAGADDFMTKPLNLQELTARIKALLRRKYNEGKNSMLVKSLKIDLNSHAVSCKGKGVSLSKYEYNLLFTLAVHRNHIVSLHILSEQLFDGPSEKAPSANAVYAHVKNLKRKLRELGCPGLIRTVYSRGYTFAI